jgi:hypothetical protein
MKPWPLLLLLAACEPRQPVKFANVEVELPADPVTLPPGPGVDAVLGNCTSCHSASTMLQQPKLTREKWLAQVDKMIEVYKAPVDPDDVPAIVDYLVAAQQVEAKGAP